MLISNIYCNLYTTKLFVHMMQNYFMFVKFEIHTYFIKSMNYLFMTSRERLIVIL